MELTQTTPALSLGAMSRARLTFSDQTLAASPYRCCWRVHRLLGGAERHRHQHRAEDLVLRRGRGGLDVGEERRRKEAALAGQAPLGLEDLRALGDALFHQAPDPLELHRGDHRADVDRLVERIADAEGVHAALQLLDEAVVDRFLDEEARAGAADLALVEPDRVDHAFDRRIEVGIVEDDERRLAAELQRQRLAGAGGGLADLPPDLGRAGEGDLVDRRGGRSARRCRRRR